MQAILVMVEFKTCGSAKTRKIPPWVNPGCSTVNRARRSHVCVSAQDGLDLPAFDSSSGWNERIL